MMAIMCSALHTDPQGLDGLLTTIRVVLLSIKDSTCFKSTSQESSGWMSRYEDQIKIKPELFSEILSINLQ